MKLAEQIQENLKFLGVSILIIAAIFLIAKIVEKKLPTVRKVSPAKRISVIAICSAMAAILHILDFPLPFLIPGFYKMDISELTVLICGFFMGPSAAVACEALKILLKILLKSTSTAFVGDFANFVVGCTWVLPASILYHTGKKRRTAIWGMVIGTLCMTVFGSAFNAIYLIPKFAELFGMPINAIVGAGTAINAHITDISSFVLLAVAPMNLLKGSSVSLLTILLYKRVEKPLNKLI